MRRLATLLLILLLWQASGAVQAVRLLQGSYEAEDTTTFTYSGSWSHQSSGFSKWEQTSSTSAIVSWQVDIRVCSMDIYTTSSAASGLDIVVDTVAISPVTFTLVGNSGLAAGYTIDLDAIDSAAASEFDVSLQMKSAGTMTFDRIFLWECIVPTATILPANNTSTPAPTWTHAPYMTVVPTATAINTSTPFVPVPTATAINTSTPASTPVDTATAANTPVDTATALDIQPTVDALLTLIAGGVIGGPTATPTDTPTLTSTPTETQTPTPEPWAFITLTSGQLTRFDYIATASDVHIANVLSLILFSAWAFFLSAVFLWRRLKK